MTDKERLRLHMAQVKAVRILQAGCIIAGLVAALFEGLPPLVLGAVMAWFIGRAMPPPDDRLDKFTRR